MTDDPDAEILIETTVIGASMEVRAVSASDGLEVSFTAPASAGQTDIQRLARAKLAYVRARGPADPPPSSPPPPKRGWVA